ncbi:MAG: hypothetical protein ACK56F_28815, partial [bacterium]
VHTKYRLVQIQEGRKQMDRPLPQLVQVVSGGLSLDLGRHNSVVGQIGHLTLEDSSLITIIIGKE